MQVVGEDKMRAKVFVDGVARGFAPNLIEVAVGRHRIEVVLEDGTRLPPRAIEVTEYDSVKRPVRPSW